MLNTETVCCKECEHLSFGCSDIRAPKYYCLHPDNMMNVVNFLGTKRKCTKMANIKNRHNNCKDFSKRQPLPDMRPLKMFY